MLFLSWDFGSDLLQVSYYEQWRHIIENGVSYYDLWAKDHLQRRPESWGVVCGECGGEPRKHVTLLLQRLGAGLQSLANLDMLFPICPSRRNMFQSWRSLIEENIKNIQPFNAGPVSSVDSVQGYVADVFHHKFSHTNLFCQRSLMTSSNEFSDQHVSTRCKCWFHKKKMTISLVARC